MMPLVVPCSHGRVVLIELGNSITEHVHPHAHILVKVAGPPRKITVRGATHVLNDDIAIMLAPWEPHGGYADDGCAPTRTLFFHIEPPQAGASRPLHPHMVESGIRSLSQTGRAALDRFYLSLMGGTARQEAADTLIEFMLDSYCSPGGSKFYPRFIDHRIRRVIRHIQVDPSLGTNLSDCAQIAGLSRPHFFYLFRHNTGLSPRLFCNSVRLEMAVNSLLDGSVPIRTISSQLGFSAPSHFTRFFLQHTGVPPRRFRKGALVGAA